MNITLFAKVVAGVFVAALGLSSCSGMGEAKSAVSLFEQLGGSQSVTKMASGLLSSSAKDPRLSGLLSHVDTPAATQKVSDQMCSTLGGGCAAPFTDSQLSTAAHHLTPAQTSAVGENFDSTLKSITSNPEVRSAVTKTLGSKLGGILGAVL
jgi:hypothetical protein